MSGIAKRIGILFANILIRKKISLFDMNFSLRLFFSFVIYIALASCASIPKESLDLSARLDRQLVALQDANATLINQVYAEKEARMTDYLDNVWFLAYLENLFSMEPTQALWEAAVNSTNPSEKVKIMSVITKEAIERYKEEKEFAGAPIIAERDSMLAMYGTEFAKARMMNNACGRLLESHYDVKSAYYSMLPEGRAERLDSLIHSSIGRLDTNLQRLKSGADIIRKAATELRDTIKIQH